MATQYNENIKIAAPLPIDTRYLSCRTYCGSPLPYSSTTEVNNTIINERYTGLTVNVKGVEYWYKNGVGNTNLVLKTITGGSAAGGVSGATNLGFFSGKTGTQALPINHLLDDAYDGNYVSLYNYYYRGTDTKIHTGAAPSDGIARRGYLRQPTISSPVYKSWVWNEYVGGNNLKGWILVDGNISNMIGQVQTITGNQVYYNGTTTFPYLQSGWTTGQAYNNASSLVIDTVTGSLITGSTIGIGGPPYSNKSNNVLQFRTLYTKTPNRIAVNYDESFIYLSGASTSTTGLNRGTGIGVFSGKTGDTMVFRTLVATGGTNINVVGQNIVISSKNNITGATNGLTNTTPIVKLGGTLCENTVISGALNTYGLEFNQLCNFKLSSNGDVVKIAGSVDCTGTNLSLKSGSMSLNMDNMLPTTGMTVRGNIKFRGVEYSNDYSSNYTCRSIPDVGYVNSVATGLRPKTAVKVATIAPIILSGLTTIDGVSVLNTDRVLVKNQINEVDNGVYNASIGVWIRANDFDSVPAGEVVSGSYMWVLSGNTNRNTAWVLTTPDPIVIGVTELTFVLFTRVSEIIGGVGIDVTPNGGTYTINVDGNSLVGNKIVWSGNTFNVDANAITSGYTTLNEFNFYTGITNSRINVIENTYVTGATNGLHVAGHNTLLGGTLSKNTAISGSSYNLCLGTTGSKLGSAQVNASASIVLTAPTINECAGCLNMYSSGATFTDLRPTGCLNQGISYASNYSLCNVNNLRWLPDKGYVDSVATGLNVRDAVLVATTSDIILSGASKIIDGISVPAGQRVLVKNQINGASNGIYVVTGGTWQRADDYNFTPAGEISNGDLIPVTSGLTQNSSLWVLTTLNPIVSGDSLNFSKFSTIIDVVSGNGILVVQSGGQHTINIDLTTNSGLCLTPSQLCVASTIAGNGLSYADGVINVNAVNCGSVGAIPVGYNTGDCLVVACTDLISATNAIVCASNGLTRSGNKVILGGSLTGNTEINTTNGGLIVTDSGNTNYFKQLNSYSKIHHESGVNKADILICNNFINLNVQNNTTGSTELIISSDSMVVKNAVSTTFGGICYDNDYHMNYTIRSLPDVGWIESRLSSLNGCNGINRNFDCFGLGGDLNIDTLINLSGNSFCIGDNSNNFIIGETYGFDINAYGLGVKTNPTYSTYPILEFTGNLAIKTEPENALGSNSEYILIWDSGDSIIRKSSFAAVALCSLTGATNGLSKSNQIVKLGGALTESTVIGNGTHLFGINTANINLTGCSINFGGNAYFKTTIPGSGGLLCVDDVSGQICQTSLSVFGGLTGATNGVRAVGQDVLLGGKLSLNTDICGNGKNLNIGIVGNSINCFELISTGNTIISTANLTQRSSNINICASGITFSDLRLLPRGIIYGGDYSSSFTNNSLVSKKYVDNVLSGGSVNIGANNGLTKLGNNIILGGVLTGDTVIGNSTYLFGVNTSKINLTGNTINLGGIVSLTTTPSTGLISDSVVVRANDGILKTVSGSVLGDKNNIYSYTAVTTNVTLNTGSSYVILANSAGGAFTITLPAIPKNGLVYKIKNSTATALTNNITIVGNGKNIDGLSTAIINSNYGAFELLYDGTEWLILSFVN